MGIVIGSEMAGKCKGEAFRFGEGERGGKGKSEGNRENRQRGRRGKGRKKGKEER